MLDGFEFVDSVLTPTNETFVSVNSIPRPIEHDCPWPSTLVKIARGTFAGSWRPIFISFNLFHKSEMYSSWIWLHYLVIGVRMGTPFESAVVERLHELRGCLKNLFVVHHPDQLRYCKFDSLSVQLGTYMPFWRIRRCYICINWKISQISQILLI